MEEQGRNQDTSASDKAQGERAKNSPKKIFKTKLSLDLRMPLLRRDSKTKLLRKIDEESESLVLKDGQTVRLRISSTSSCRSYRGELAHVKLKKTGSASSSSIESPSPDVSLPETPESCDSDINNAFANRMRSAVVSQGVHSPSTPESPTPDIDNLFAKRLQVTMSSPDSMAHVKALAHKLNFFPNSEEECNKSNFQEKLESIAVDEDVFPVCVVEDHLEVNNAATVVEPSKEERKENLKKSMDWIRNELRAMRDRDQEIAKQLMAIHLEIQHLRLQKTVVSHKTILEDVAGDAEDEKEWILGGIEPPAHLQFVAETKKAFLRDMGLTKLNITNRRFSLR